jgi:hypothetical protein
MTLPLGDRSQRENAMSVEFKVVRMADLFVWSRTLNQVQFENEFASAFQEALNREARDGWVYVETYAYHQHVGPGYAVFKREVPGAKEESHAAHRVTDRQRD